ncbi:hypothetical protein H8356DRAFT_1271176 [Neocallimastix lanati (nom. inval.)]|jgi:hypothetical protein|uniref:Uncharacterized protein n=1 Tax=Neocallimastix californiae TaxID=1754190 RepID=A0A1Y2ENE6_9FUNG|nr:hypothetical protein H8356DRAFT_1271176 [Neocallimastix sp. JGI-2020a]ORY73029.1 hypothetical protein LY90DRAFT_666866 [Neocallimastix californiae]|eukprot:ORY73029.1 hypothetical protein LY90DRAFT_666866 [Neocallimastix californiae]
MTHTKTYEVSYVFTINSESSHTRKDSGLNTNETNWSTSIEISHNDDYSRMSQGNFNNNKQFGMRGVGNFLKKAERKLNPFRTAVSLVEDTFNVGSKTVSANASCKANNIT